MIRNVMRQSHSLCPLSKWNFDWCRVIASRRYVNIPFGGNGIKDRLTISNTNGSHACIRSIVPRVFMYCDEIVLNGSILHIVLPFALQREKRRDWVEGV